MIAVSKKELRIIKEILRAKVPDCEVRAFGSRVKNSHKKTSDLDLAIVGKKKLSFSKIYNLKEAFMESDLPFRVDVLDYNDVYKNIRDNIDKKFEVI